MAPQSYPFDEVVRTLDMHPHPVWKALGYQEKFGQWHRGQPNVMVFWEDISDVYQISKRTFDHCYTGCEKLVSTNDLALLLNIPPRSVRIRSYPIGVHRAYHTRYLKTASIRKHMAKYANKPTAPNPHKMMVK